MQIMQYRDKVPLRVTTALCAELADVFFSYVSDDAPGKGEIWIAIQEDDWETLVNFELDVDALSREEYRYLAQVLALYQKRDDLPLGFDRKAVARKKFEESETVCAQTNELLRCVSSGRASFCDRDVEPVILLAQRKIADILGERPSFEEVGIRFGPGASTSTRRSRSSPFVKLTDTIACSEALAPLFRSMIGEDLVEPDLAWGILPYVNSAQHCAQNHCLRPERDQTGVQPAAWPPRFVRVHDGTLRFVPKNAKTDRAIVVEPVLNTLFQAGYGDYMADRLRRYGVDISDQTRNQTLAQYGSLTNALATLDLSSASDTVSTEVVWMLLPPDWAHTLSRLRTPCVVDDDRRYRLEKFSSMGNGTTFPLETLLFYGLASACVSLLGLDMRLLSVYGDDIIVPTGAAGLLVRVLHALGFKTNKQKSFTDGPFRESCGSDYYLGYPVRPTFLRRSVDGPTAFVLHNGFYSRGYTDACQLVRQVLGFELNTFVGPSGYGDGHLWDDCAVLAPCRREEGYSGFSFSTYTEVPRRLVLPESLCMVAALYTPQNGDIHRTRNFQRAEQAHMDASRRSYWLGKPRYPYKGLRAYAIDFEASSPRVYASAEKGRIEVSLPSSTHEERRYRRTKVYIL